MCVLLIRGSSGWRNPDLGACGGNSSHAST